MSTESLKAALKRIESFFAPYSADAHAMKRIAREALEKHRLDAGETPEEKLIDVPPHETSNDRRGRQSFIPVIAWVLDLADEAEWETISNGFLMVCIKNSLYTRGQLASMLRSAYPFRAHFEIAWNALLQVAAERSMKECQGELGILVGLLPPGDPEVPPPNCRQRLVKDGKPCSRSSCDSCGKFAPKWENCNLRLGVTDA